MKLLILVPILFLSACSWSITKPPEIIEVKVPVPVYCNITEPIKPDFEFDKLKSGQSIFEQVKVLLADRKQHLGYEVELQTAISECNKSDSK